LIFDAWLWLRWCCVSRARKRIPHGFAHGIRNSRLPPKTHFRLRRVHIHVDLFQRRLDEQQRRRVNTMGQDRSIAFGQRSPDHPVAHKPSIHKQILRVARRPAIAGR